MIKYLFNFLFLLLLILCEHNLYSQYFSSGEDAASIKWRQINTQQYRIVYPKDYENEARRLAIILNEVYDYGGISLNHTPKKFNVLVHNQSAKSNGFVFWAPKRMELFPTPDQNSYGSDFLEQLGIHEFRHVVQVDKLNTGFTKLLYFSFGQQATGAITGLYFPLWYLEGDATLTETTLSNSGRGRLPEFEQGIKAQILERGIYSYDKACFGSYNDYIPNQYEMGYHMVAGSRKYFGQNIWLKATENTAKNSWYPFIFSRSLKKYSGFNKVALYDTVFSKLKRDWLNETPSNTNEYINITPSNSNFKSYLYPQIIEDGSIIAEVQSPDEATHFVKIDTDGRETKLLVPGTRNPDPICAQGDMLVWTEQTPHVRWANKSYSVIKVANLATGNIIQITHRYKYFSPTISPDGKRIAAVFLDNINHSSLHIIDINSGEIINRFGSDSCLIMTPSWSDKENLIVTVLLNENGKKISMLNINNGQWHDITNASNTEIKYPVMRSNTVYFSGAWTGIDNIYKINPNNKNSIEQLSTEKFGASYPKIFNDDLYYCSYHSNGYQVVKTELKNLIPIEYKDSRDYSIHLFEESEKKELGKPVFDYSGADTITTKKYSKWNLINVHSWAPIAMDINDQTIHQGAMIASQNLLNTMIIEAGYNADRNFSTEKYYTKISYKGWFPVLSLDLKMGDSKTSAHGFYTSTVDKDTFALDFSEKQLHVKIQPEISLPLNLTKGKYYNNVTPSIRYYWYHVSGYDYIKTYGQITDSTFYPSSEKNVHVPSINYQTMEYDLFAYHLLRSAQNDITSSWGQVVQLNFRHNPWGDYNNGTQTALMTKIYTPGFAKHHTFRFENDFQFKTDGSNKSTINVNGTSYQDTYHFNSIITMPRGYDMDHIDQKIYSFKGDYIFPLVNPDLSLGGIYYLKRVKTNLFCDYSWTERKLKNISTSNYEFFRNYYYSLGTEMRFEGHVLRFIFPFDLGIRYAYLPLENKHYTQFLFSININ